MNKLYTAVCMLLMMCMNTRTYAQVTLTGTTYTETFDNLASGLPAGFFISTNASASSVGTQASFNTTPTAWNVTSAGFKNYASADGLTASATATEQAGSTDRALGVRQTGTANTGGDPGAAMYFQIANTTGLQNLQLTFSLQSLDIASPRTTTWQVQYGIGATPTTFTSVSTVPSPLTTGGSTFTSTTVTANFGSALDDVSDIVWIRIAALSSSVGSGSRATSAIDDFTLSYSAFGTGNSVTVTEGTNAAEPATNGTFIVALNTAAPAGGVSITYTLSGTATEGADYADPGSGTLILPAGSTSATIHLHTLDDQLLEPTETITFTLTGATNNYHVNTTPAIITITDNEGSVAYYYHFNTCSGTTFNNGFTSESLAGAQVWNCTTSGYTGSAAQMNGFASGSAHVNEDWLISSSLDLSGTTNPLLAFRSRSRFTGDPLQVYITTNYTGTVSTTTWTELNGRFPQPGSDVWTYSENISLSAFRNTDVRIAFRYTSGTYASQWTVDDVYVFDAVNPPSPTVTPVTRLIDFRQQNAGTTSANKAFIFWVNDASSNITVTAPDGFQLSKDGTSFSNTIVYTPAELQNRQITAYARFAPTLTGTAYGGMLSFTGTGITSNQIMLQGNTISMSSTLNVVNWNVEWFGSTSPGQGPADVTMQADHVKKVIEYINADVYAFSEIVDTALFGSTIRSIGGYHYVISDYASLATDPADPSFATNYTTGQKLAFAYKTSVLSNVTSRGLLRTSSTAVSNWSTGRVPLLVSATATKNGGSTEVDFIVLHAKAGSTQSDYERRLAGARELKDTLDAFFSTRRIIILGDYNDDLDVSIYTAAGTVPGSFDVIVRDSVDANSYHSVTLPLSRAGLSSTEGNAEMIDHVIISNEMNRIYVPFSATLFNDIGTLANVANYSTTTSDHFPVMTRYLFTSTLPVKLVHFNGRKAQQVVRLDWITSNEVNTKEFTIERSSDAASYTAIGSVPASGNASGSRHYHFSDIQPLAGTNYYRLSISDNDGKRAYSGTVRVVFDQVITFSIAPNPATTNIIVSKDTPGPVRMQIADMQGRIVKETLLQNQRTPISVHDLTKGVYMIRFLSGTVQVQKIVIE